MLTLNRATYFQTRESNFRISDPLTPVIPIPALLSMTTPQQNDFMQEYQFTKHIHTTTQ
jgi:hypothetical protein